MGVVVTDAPAVDQYAYYGTDITPEPERDSPVGGARR
jgi:hypothetical protein